MQIVEIIDWYDGITEALIRNEDGLGMYASMIAWSPKQNLRIFGLVSIDDSTINELQTLVVASKPSNTQTSYAWRRLRRSISTFLQQVQGSVNLLLCDELDGEARKMLEVAAELVLLYSGKTLTSQQRLRSSINGLEYLRLSPDGSPSPRQRDGRTGR